MHTLYRQLRMLSCCA